MSDVFTAAPAALGPNGEEMVTWFMHRYGVERDPAIGALEIFMHGWGQPSHEMMVAFPDLAALYFEALASFPKASETVE